MEGEFYHNEFEELIKDKADQYKMYPSDRVWKGIDSTLRTRRKWYWTGFVVLLTAISYFATTELLSPTTARPVAPVNTPAPAHTITPAQLDPFTNNITSAETDDPGIVSGITVEDSGDITASFLIPLKYIDPASFAKSPAKTSLLITGLAPLGTHEAYNIELSWPIGQVAPHIDAHDAVATGRQLSSPLNTGNTEEKGNRINWLQEHVFLNNTPAPTRKIRWQLAFSPTVNYRKLTGGKNARAMPSNSNIPVAMRIDGDIDALVDHKPALGFELGTHGLLSLTPALTLKGGVQFNYSKYDIRAFRTTAQYATIALNSSTGGNGGAIVSYTDIGNFGGSSVEDLKNQYYQLSVPVGLELKLLGNDRLQLNIAGTLQPTYLFNRNTYLITTDFKNYTRAPSLVRRWNVNAGAEAFVSYNRGGVKWQVGPQFRYQLLSSYENVYPIKEYLMEYGIKIGITKTIR